MLHQEGDDHGRILLSFSCPKDLTSAAITFKTIRECNPPRKGIAMLGIFRRCFQQAKILRELEKEEVAERAKEAAERAQAERIAWANEHRQKIQRQRKVLSILRQGKVPDVPENYSGPVPFKLQRNERLIFVQKEVGYAEIRVRRQVVGRSSSVSVRVMRGVSVKSGESVGTPVETDIFTPRGTGVFAVSTRHIFFNGLCQGRRQNIPVGRSKSVPPERSLASVNVRASCSGEVSQRQAGNRLGG